MLGTWVTMSWCKYFCKFLDKVDKLNVWARVCVCAWFIYTVFMSTLYSEALNHEWTVVCDRVWDVDKEVVCSSSVFKKGRSRKRAGELGAAVSISPYNLPSPLESLFCCCLCSKVRSEKFPLCELLMPYKQNRHKKCFLTLMGVFLMCEGSQSTLQRAGVLTIESKKHNSQCVFFLALKLWGLQKRIWATFQSFFSQNSSLFVKCEFVCKKFWIWTWRGKVQIWRGKVQIWRGKVRICRGKSLNLENKVRIMRVKKSEFEP